MIVKKPTIVIYTHHADTPLCQELCAGVEEEGILYEIIPWTAADADQLSRLACEASILGVGIGVREREISLHIRGMNPVHGANDTTSLFFYRQADAKVARQLGTNAARVIKKVPFRMEE